jgi:hypothetical protein
MKDRAPAYLREHHVRGWRPGRGIARLAGHQQTSTTELVYRRELRPVIATGAEIMDWIFSP